MNRAERAAARVLFWGAVVSIAIMTCGLVTAGRAPRAGLDISLHELRGEHRERESTADTVTSFHQVARGLAHRPMEPVAVIALGVLSLLVTPIAAVAATIPAFLMEGDRRYAAISTFLLLALLTNLWFGGGRASESGRASTTLGGASTARADHVGRAGLEDGRHPGSGGEP